MRGRKKIQEANELYKRGRYREAVAAFEAAEALVPNLPTLWLNKGYTCRQLIAPGGHDPESRRAADCALAAFKRLAELAPKDPRADQLTVQTWFDIDDFATLEKTFLERNRRAPDDYDVVHGLQEVYYKWGKWPQALEWSKRAAALRPTTPRRSTASAPSSGRFSPRTAAVRTWPPTTRARARRPKTRARAAQAEAQGHRPTSRRWCRRRPRRPPGRRRHGQGSASISPTRRSPISKRRWRCARTTRTR